MVASIVELGNNSASISYGGTTTGSDIFPLLQNTDQWLRNDTYQGTATAGSPSSTTVYNTLGGSIYTTQLAPGATILMAGQLRTVATVTSDTQFTVTAPFSPAISAQTAIKAINTTLTGTSAATTVRGNTNGNVTVTNGGTVVTGVGTYFLSDCTNSVATLVVAQSTLAYDGAGNLTGTGSSWLTSQGVQNGLYPGDSIQVIYLNVSYYFTIATVTGDGAATVTTTSNSYSAVLPSGNIYTLYKATNGVAGRTIVINGRVRTIQAINSNTQLTINNPPFDFSDSNLRLKVYPRGTVSNAVGNVVIGSTGCSTQASSGNLTVPTTAGAITGNIVIGAVANVITASGTGVLSAGTTIVAQMTANSAAVVAPTRNDSNASGWFVSFGSTAGILPGYFVSSSAGIQFGNVYVANVNSVSGTVGLYVLGNTAASPVTSVNTSTATNFYQPGGAGLYLLSSVPTTQLSAATVQVSGIFGGAGTTNFAWDISTGDPVWVGDELRTFNFSTNGTFVQNNTVGGNLNIAYTTDIAAVPYGFSGSPIGTIKQTYQAVPYRKDDTYINGVGTAFTTELRVNDELVIDGTEVFVTSIISGTQFRVREDFTHTLTTSSTFYKKKKLHGYVFEGTREGGTLGNASTYNNWKLSGNTAVVTTVNTSYLIGTNSITLNAAPITVGAPGLVYIPLKIPGAGGAPTLLQGQATVVAGTVTGIGTAFTTQLHVGAEIQLAGRYMYVSGITSDTVMTVIGSVNAVNWYLPVSIYRTVPLYTYAYQNPTGNQYLLSHAIKNTIYSQADSPPQVYYATNGADYIEYVYSAPNKFAEGSTTLFNTSLDRKYVAFRYFPLLAGSYNSPAAGVLTSTATAFGGYSTPVYERWTAAYAGAGGVPINQADLSGGTMVYGSQATTTFSQAPYGMVCGSIVVPPMGALMGTATYSPFNFAYTTANNAPSTANTTVNSSTTGGVGYTVPSNTILTGATAGPVIGNMAGVPDIIYLTQTTGGYLYLFASSRYLVIQGKSFANQTTNFIGVVEYERAQPEDTGAGGGASGLAYNAFTASTAGSQWNQNWSVSGATGIAPWPTYGYINGARLPVGAGQFATNPVTSTVGIHGCVISTPRVRNSAGDLVGVNANIYSALTITTGRWGHVVEMLATGVYQTTGTVSAMAFPAQSINSIPQIHMGQIIPVYTNVYNSKRFMFSPVVVLGPAYDPDVRGRIYGLKILPSALGSFMDTVSITVDSNYFYDTTFTATDHWVLTSTVTTYKFNLAPAVNTNPQQAWRSLEDNTTLAANSASTTFTNNFRFALPA